MVFVDEMDDNSSLNEELNRVYMHSDNGAIDIEDQVLCVKNMFDAVSH